MQSITQRIIELREADRTDPLSFASIAQIINQEFPEMTATKDSVRGVYVRNREELPAVTRKVVVIGDVHAAPDSELLEALIAEDPDLIVIAGDLLDSAQLSSYEKNLNEKRRAFRDEIDTCRTYLKTLRERTKAVILIMMGNHDHRFYKLASKVVPEDVLELMGTPFDMIIKGIEGVELVNTPMTITRPNGKAQKVVDDPYLLLLGDAIISHMNFTGRNPGDAVNKLYPWIMRWRHSLDLPDPALLIQAHTHKASKVSLDGGHVILHRLAQICSVSE